MMMRKNWQMNANVPEQGSVLDRVLAARGICDAAAQRLFFQGSLADLHDPFLLPDMDRACDLFEEALKSGQTVLIHGDYDVDGLTASAFMVKVLGRLGFACQTIVPDRITEGYGLSESSVRKIIEANCSLLLTVDCGIGGFEAVTRIRDAGMKVIVTDHHECPATLPPAHAVIDPKRQDSDFPFAALAGVGVALKLAQALCQRLNQPPVWQEWIDLVALGTIADIVPLVDENRILARHGLQALREKPSPGLAALLQVSGAEAATVDERVLGYALAPRLNAAGRLGQPHLALELLLAKEAKPAQILAEKLDALNRERQTIEAQVTEEAAAQIQQQENWSRAAVLVAAGENWHVGVLGIAAARLVERFERPVIVLSRQDELYQGSGRSFAKINLYAVLERFHHHLIQFGGHQQAAGLSVAADQLAAFSQAVAAADATSLPLSRHTVTADLQLESEQVSLKLAQELKKLAPFGEGNPQPLFIVRHLGLQQMQTTQNGKHLRLSFLTPSSSQLLSGIAFGLGELAPCLNVSESVDILFTPEVNVWRGRKNLQLKVLDIKPSLKGDVLSDRPWELEAAYHQTGDLEQLRLQYQIEKDDLIPRREEYQTVYRFLNRFLAASGKLIDLSLLARYINNQTRLSLNMFRLSRILTIFQEVGLVELQRLESDRVCLAIRPVEKRVDLKSAPSYLQLHPEKEDA